MIRSLAAMLTGANDQPIDAGRAVHEQSGSLATRSRSLCRYGSRRFRLAYDPLHALTRACSDRHFPNHRQLSLCQSPFSGSR